MSTGGALDGRHALVTGAAGGIGRAIVTSLLGAGARVTLAGRDAARLVDAARTLSGGEIATVADFDVTDRARIARGAAAAREQFGPVSILVNNAGAAPTAPFAKITETQWNEVLSTDLSSVFLVTQEFLPDLRSHGQGARIINIASTAGLAGYRYAAAYCAAKHGVVGLTRALALELSHTGITVNAVCPGFTDTPLIERAIKDIVARSGRSGADVHATFTASNPLGRLVDPSEVADTVLWLSQPGSSAITGQAIAVAGGEVMTG